MSKKYLLHKFYANQHLNSEEAEELMLLITQGSFSEMEIAIILMFYKTNSVTLNELSSFRKVLLERSLKFSIPFKAIDVCGTGGDEKDTFNISTLSALIIAACGYKVVKHGNYGVSCTSGSSNILEYFGYKFTNKTEILLDQLQETNICFLHAPLFHPAMKSVAQIRKDLGVRTVFNILGPLVNPALPTAQLIGVHSPQLVELYREVLIDQPSNFCVVHSLAGYDEVSLTSEVMVATRAAISLLKPVDFGCQQLQDSDLAGAEDVTQAAKLLETILKGQGSVAQNNVVSANAGLLLWVLDQTKQLKECVDKARASLLSGKGFNVLQAVRGA